MNIKQLQMKKSQGQKIKMLVLYDYQLASLANEAQVDMLLVGDSFGPVLLGYQRMTDVTMDEMLHHCRAVSRGAPDCIVVGDMPFMSERESTEQAVHNAARLIREGMCDAVKVDGDITAAPTIRAIAETGMPIMGQIGLTHLSMELPGDGGIGGDPSTGKRLLEAAVAFEEAGAFAIALAFVNPEVGRMVSKKLRVPVIGAGAGPWCDGQSATVYDILGILPGDVPNHLKRYAHLRPSIKDAFSEFTLDVEEGRFP